MNKKVCPFKKFQQCLKDDCALYNYKQRECGMMTVGFEIATLRDAMKQFLHKMYQIARMSNKPIEGIDITDEA